MRPHYASLRVHPGGIPFSVAKPAWFLGFVALVTGCAGWESRIFPRPVTPQREARKTEAVQTFETHRDAAQVSAALDRWQSGDAAGCERMLAAVVARCPDYCDARLQLGQVLWSRGDAAAAEPHLRAVLEKQPDCAEGHHALGLLLDGTGRSDEARQHFSLAWELEPDNDIYRLTSESTNSGLRNQR
jgi:Flp pilus assembly protein TadD